jgi:O-antigen/teichoic acid export membrane protein
LSIKKLAGQTLWYGVSSIAARFINYFLTPYLTYALTKADYGRMGAIYSAIPLMNVVFTYGMETAYFRFVQKNDRTQSVNNTATISLLFSTIFLSIVLWMNQSFLADVTSLKELPLLIQLSIAVIGLDALSTIPFARLRNENRPLLFAFTKVAGIALNIIFTIFFISYCSGKIKADPNNWVHFIYKPNLNPITYVLIANVIQSGFTLLLLGKWAFPKKWSFDFSLWKEMMIYALPMLIAGMGGMVNETFDRLMLGWWLPPITPNYADEQRGIYNACYKLSLLITLFIQAFRMGAEPFFFKQAEGKDPHLVYARVMKFFVIIISVMFLVVSLYLPVWKYFISPKEWEGLSVVPILLLANMSLGIYYNLSVWYKITNNTMSGAWITLIGTSITIVINFIFIPRYSYTASAWATFFCYFTMMVVSYLWGQKKYYVPYAWKKLSAYLVIVVLLFFLHKFITSFVSNVGFSLGIALTFTLAYLYFILRVEKKEFQRIPFLNKLVK